MSATHDFVTASGETVTAPLNLDREQWGIYKATSDNPTVDELWELADALKIGDKLGVVDVVQWGRSWSSAFIGALGLGESDGSTEPSTDPTATRSRSTSGGSRASRSKK